MHKIRAIAEYFSLTGSRFDLIKSIDTVVEARALLAQVEMITVIHRAAKLVLGAVNGCWAGPFKRGAWLQCSFLLKSIFVYMENRASPVWWDLT